MFHGWLHYWSYYLAPFGLTGMYLAGRKNKPAYGWLLSCFTQLLWLAYAVTTAQFGFIPGTLGYLVIYIKNWRTNRAPAPHSDTKTPGSVCYNCGHELPAGARTLEHP